VADAGRERAGHAGGARRLGRRRDDPGVDGALLVAASHIIVLERPTAARACSLGPTAARACSLAALLLGWAARPEDAPALRAFLAPTATEAAPLELPATQNGVLELLTQHCVALLAAPATATLLQTMSTYHTAAAAAGALGAQVCVHSARTFPSHFRR